MVNIIKSGVKTRKVQRAISLKNLEQSILADEGKEVMNMSQTNARIFSQHNDSGYRVEFELVDTNVSDVKKILVAMRENGFVPVVSAKKETEDYVGKVGTVKSVTAKDGKQGQYNVLVSIDGAEGKEMSFTAFQPTAYRTGDRVRLDKNDKGYYFGSVLTGDIAQQSHIPF